MDLTQTMTTTQLAIPEGFKTGTAGRQGKKVHIAYPNTPDPTRPQHYRAVCDQWLDLHHFVEPTDASICNRCLQSRCLPITNA